MNSNLQHRLANLENIISIQKDCVKVLPDAYYTGMLNGLLLAHSVFTDDRLIFVSYKKKTKNKVRRK
jgi:hypothetical protein